MPLILGVRSTNWKACALFLCEMFACVHVFFYKGLLQVVDAVFWMLELRTSCCAFFQVLGIARVDLQPKKEKCFILVAVMPNATGNLFSVESVSMF